jgi:hypothetical protein
MLKPLKIIAITLTLGLAFYASIYFFFKSTKSYVLAENFVRANQLISSRTGDIQNVNLGLENFSFHGNGSEGQAQFTLHVTGSKSVIPVFIKLEQRAGWWVTYASTTDSEGRIIVIKNANSTP